MIGNGTLADFYYLAVLYWNWTEAPHFSSYLIWIFISGLDFYHSEWHGQNNLFFMTNLNIISAPLLWFKKSGLSHLVLPSLFIQLVSWMFIKKKKKKTGFLNESCFYRNHTYAIYLFSQFHEDAKPLGLSGSSFWKSRNRPLNLRGGVLQSFN